MSVYFTGDGGRRYVCVFFFFPSFLFFLFVCVCIYKNNCHSTEMQTLEGKST